MTAARGWICWAAFAWCGLCSGGGGEALATPAQPDTSVETLLQDARAMTRQLRLVDAEQRLRLALRSGATTDQEAYAQLLLGIVAHERRDANAAELAYRAAFERSSSAETRAVARSNLDLLADERARYFAYLSLRDRLDAWLVLELALAAVIAAVVLRASRQENVNRPD